MPLLPKVAFDNFAAHLARFEAKCDTDVEDQFFERKAIPLPASGNASRSSLGDIKEQIKETVSAFANSNAVGGLLVGCNN
jgi:hypothetical protein